MKKNFLKNAMLMMATVAVVTMFTSCREDEGLYMEIGNDLVSKGLTIGIDGGFYNIPIKSNGEWTASLPEECDWAGLLKKNGNGNETLCLGFDPNYAFPERSTILTISNNESSYEIVLKQETSNENTGYSNLANSKGLGWGYDPINMTISNKSAVLSLATIDSLKKKDPMSYGNMYVYNKIAQFDATNCNVDSIEEKRDTLGVKLSIDISYKNFSFGLSGAYESSEDRNTTMKRYRTAVAYPTLEARVSYADVIAHYYEWLETGNNNETDLRGSLLSFGFARASKKLVTACNGQTSDSAKIRKLAMAIVGEYGPAVVVNIKMGGALTMQFYMDSTWTKENMGVKDATVKAKIDSTLTSYFKLDAGVSVTYEKAATEIFKNSVYSCLISGGAKEEMESLYDCFKTQNYSNLNSEVGKWITNISNHTTDDDTNLAELLSVDIVPIWVFVDDDEAQEVLRSCTLEAYKDVPMIEQLAKVYL